MTAVRISVSPASGDAMDYCAADDVIDYADPAIQALAAELSGSPDAGHQADDTGYARAAFTFVRDMISHSADLGRYSTAYRASEVLRHGNAICFGKAHLLIALLRASGIPAGLCYQRLADDDHPGRFDLHGLAAVALNGRWSRLDPRGNKPGIDAQFDLDNERLAWTADPARGEIDYPQVYPSPPPLLLAGLRAARPGPEPYAHLPAELS
jgi:transglutaminase-like putative cysteine protease